jgi:hypothetical protein
MIKSRDSGIIMMIHDARAGPGIIMMIVKPPSRYHRNHGQPQAQAASASEAQLRPGPGY